MAAPRGAGNLLLLDLITFRFHSPRLGRIFRSREPVAPEALRQAAREWARGNIWRIILLLVAFMVLLRALMVGAITLD